MSLLYEPLNRAIANFASEPVFVANGLYILEWGRDDSCLLHMNTNTLCQLLADRDERKMIRVSVADSFNLDRLAHIQYGPHEICLDEGMWDGEVFADVIFGSKPKQIKVRLPITLPISGEDSPADVPEQITDDELLSVLQNQ